MSEERRPKFMRLSIEKKAASPAVAQAPGAQPSAAPEAGVPAPDVSGAPPAAASPGVSIRERSAPFLRETASTEDAPRRTGEEAAADSSLYERAECAARAIRVALCGPAPRIAVVLGSGLGAFADSLEAVRFVEYEAIPGFARSTVPGHRGRLAIGKCGGIAVLAMQGRFHYYEGYSLEQVTFPVRVLARLGVRILVLTNAAGAVSPKLAPGDLMVIEDHLNLMGANPLRGPNDERLGPRFPDMTEAWPLRLREALRAAAPPGTPLTSGVYAALAGPSYETPAEIRMLATLGADAVGMSTVPEAIVANHSGIRCLGISAISNYAAGIVRDHRLTHEEVVLSMRKVGGTLVALLDAALPELEREAGR